MYFNFLKYSRNVAGNQDDEGGRCLNNPTYGKLQCCTTQLHTHSPSSYEMPESMDQSDTSFPHVTYYDAVNIRSERAAGGQTYDVLYRGLPNGPKISSMFTVHLSSDIDYI